MLRFARNGNLVQLQVICTESVRIDGCADRSYLRRRIIVIEPRFPWLCKFYRNISISQIFSIVWLSPLRNWDGSQTKSSVKPPFIFIIDQIDYCTNRIIWQSTKTNFLLILTPATRVCTRMRLYHKSDPLLAEPNTIILFVHGKWQEEIPTYSM